MFEDVRRGIRGFEGLRGVSKARRGLRGGSGSEGVMRGVEWEWRGTRGESPDNHTEINSEIYHFLPGLQGFCCRLHVITSN